MHASLIFWHQLLCGIPGFKDSSAWQPSANNQNSQQMLLVGNHQQLSTNSLLTIDHGQPTINFNLMIMAPCWVSGDYHGSTSVLLMTRSTSQLPPTPWHENGGGPMDAKSKTNEARPGRRWLWTSRSNLIKRCGTSVRRWTIHDECGMSVESSSGTGEPWNDDWWMNNLIQLGNIDRIMTPISNHH